MDKDTINTVLDAVIRIYDNLENAEGLSRADFKDALAEYRKWATNEALDLNDI